MTYKRSEEQVSGPTTIFPKKIRIPINFTATPTIRRKLTRATKRFRLSRSDVICLLIEYFSDQLPAALKTHATGGVK